MDKKSKKPIPIGLLTVIKVFADHLGKNIFMVRNNESYNTIMVSQDEMTNLYKDSQRS